MPAFQVHENLVALGLRHSVPAGRSAELGGQKLPTPSGAGPHAIVPQRFPPPLGGALYRSWDSFARPQNCPIQEGLPFAQGLPPALFHEQRAAPVHTPCKTPPPPPLCAQRNS
ncbi:UNVERIFIED_CONTAM: hypothetical protein K2H54_020377 [Gekko kuhli]